MPHKSQTNVVYSTGKGQVTYNEDDDGDNNDDGNQLACLTNHTTMMV